MRSLKTYYSILRKKGFYTCLRELKIAVWPLWLTHSRAAIEQIQAERASSYLWHKYGSLIAKPFDVHQTNEPTRIIWLCWLQGLGHAFEHLMMQELIAYLGYNGYENYLSYWHTYNDYEVDAVLGDAEVAIEFKSCSEVQSRHLSGLKAFKEEHPEAKLIIVSMDEQPRLFNGVEVLPAKEFLTQLWGHKIINDSIITC